MSHTWTGGRYDNGMISVIIYTAYQAIMEKINANSQLKSIGHKNPKDARKISETVSQLPLTHDPSVWGSTFANILSKDFESNYTHIFGSIWIICMMACLPSWLSDWIIEWLCKNLLEHFGDKGTADWIRNYYKPQADVAVTTFNIPIYLRPVLAMKLVGVIIKIFWAFAW